MGFHKIQKTVSWLLAMAIFNLALIAPGGVVVANPMDTGKDTHFQIAKQGNLACDTEMQLGMDKAKTECDACVDATCNLSCSFSVHAQIITEDQVLQLQIGEELFRDSITFRLTPLTSSPPPKSPRQLNS
jgi:hypothetical protein